MSEKIENIKYEDQIQVSDEDFKKYINFLKKKDEIFIHPFKNDDQDNISEFEIIIKFSSLNKIFKYCKIKETQITNYINFATVTENTITETKTNNIVTYDVDKEYINLLEKNQYYYVMKPEYADLDDEEKVLKEIRIKKNIFEKIFSLNQTNIIELLNYIDIIITTKTYEHLQNVIERKKSLKENYRILLKFLQTYNINGKYDISSYSLKKIFQLAEMDEYDIPNYASIKILNNLDDTEKHLRKIRLMKINNKASSLDLKNTVLMKEQSKIRKLGNDVDISKKCKKNNFINFENNLKNISEIINKNNKDIENKKNELNKKINNKNNLFIGINDINENEVYIKYSYINILNKLNNQINNVDLLDYKNNQIKILKNNLINLNENSIKYFIIIFDNNKEKILIDLQIFKNYLDNWTNQKNLKIKINDIISNKEYIFKLIDVDIEEQNEINDFPIQEEEMSILNEKKTNLLNEINLNKNSLYFYQQNEIITYSIYDKIIKNTENINNFTVPNYINKENKIVISKEKLLSNPINKDNELISILNNNDNSNIIINKSEIINSLNNIKYLNDSTLNLKNYIDNSTKEINILNIKIENIPEEELPDDQPEMINLYNNTLNQEINNSLSILIINDNLILKPILEKIINSSKFKDLNSFEIITINQDSLNPNKHIVLKKSEILDLNNSTIYNIIVNKVNNKKYIISKLDFQQNLNNSLDNKDINIIDFKNNNIQLLKSKCKIVQNNEINLDNFYLEKQNIEYLFLLQQDIKNSSIYTEVIDINNNKNLIRKEYINLINIYNSEYQFDIFNLPNKEDKIININRKNLPNNPKEYTHIVDINNNKEYLINVDDILNNDKHNELVDEPFNFELHNNNNKISLKLKEIKLKKKTIIINTLPEQNEELFLKNIKNTIQYLINDKQSDLIILTDINNQNKFILYEYINDIKNDNFLKKLNPINIYEYDDNVSNFDLNKILKNNFLQKYIAINNKEKNINYIINKKNLLNLVENYKESFKSFLFNLKDEISQELLNDVNFKDIEFIKVNKLNLKDINKKDIFNEMFENDDEEFENNNSNTDIILKNKNKIIKKFSKNFIYKEVKLPPQKEFYTIRRAVISKIKDNEN